MIKKYFALLFFSLSFSILSFSKNIDISSEDLMLLVHKTPTCGCCKMWMKHIEEDGFTAYGQDHQNLMKIKENITLNLNIDHVIQQYLLMDLSLKVIFLVNS